MSSNPQPLARVQRLQSVVMPTACAAGALDVLAHRSGLPGVLAWPLMAMVGAVLIWSVWWLGQLGDALTDAPGAGPETVPGVVEHGRRRGPLLTVAVSPTGVRDDGGQGRLEVTVFARGALAHGSPVSVVGDLTRGAVVLVGRAGPVVPLWRARWAGARALDKGAARDLPR